MKNFSPLKNQKGQLGVFVGMSILVVISLLAFVINVGLFVKAKINLQNAVDAAAYAGAATQARRLTNMGYLNWEMRNTMKEWMFKYYIVGNMGNSVVRDSDPSFGLMDFRPKKFSATSGNGLNVNDYSKFNIPRNCINFGSTHNICNVFGVPGVPRFPSIGSPGPAALTKEFTDQAVSIKSRNCLDRSVLNFSTTLMWTFGKGGTNNGFQDAPNLLSHRPGAWPQTLEYAIRMRNLEFIVNRPPVEEGICISEGSNCISLSELISTGGSSPVNERPIAAFNSAYRNLGGGSRDVNGGGDHLSIKSTFKLTELAPAPLTFEPGKGLSGFLIPDGKSYPGTGFQYGQKHYVDMRALPINYVVFFTTFVPADQDFSADITSEGSCSSSITGIPVPFYITGFYKNPKVLTYYAVKGEAKYMGLFYPFNKGDGLTIRAYAAAKPMGGRIGPLLYRVDGDTIKGRDDDKTRSKGFIVGMIPNSGSASSSGGGWLPGYPIPFETGGRFYVHDEDDPIGGTPDSTTGEITFSLPNMVYDFSSGASISGGNIDIVEAMGDVPSPTQPSGSGSGLYDSEQYHLLKSNLNTNSPSASHIEGKVIEAKRATKWDAMNYLIPTHNNEATKNEAPSAVQGQSTVIGGSRYIRYNLYAPICSDFLLYSCDAEELGTAVHEFLSETKDAMNLYLDELGAIADGLRNTPASDGGGSNYVAAADTLYPNGGTLDVASPPTYDISDTDCYSSATLADKFHIFFNIGVDPSNMNAGDYCGVTPLLWSVTKFVDEKSKNETTKNFIQPEYYLSGGSSLPSNLHSAFQPTTRKGAGASGEMSHPFLGTPESSGKRNFYSTKLFSIKKMLNAADPVSYNDLFSYAEQYSGGSLRTGSNTGIVSGDSNIVNILNPIDLQEFGEFKESF